MNENKSITRRQFLIGTSVLGLAALGGGGYFALREPVIEFPETSCGQASADAGKVLVAYGSQFGSTGEVAKAVADALCERGAAVDVRRIANVKALSTYQAVVIGAPVNSSEWMPEVVDFVRANQAALSKVPTAYFLTCMTLALTDAESDVQKIAGIFDLVQEQIPDVRPVSTGLFAGALDYSKMSLMFQMLYRAMTPNAASGDFRDWAAIRNWGETIRPLLLGA